MLQKNCPTCAIAMREIKLDSTYGTPVLINQCDSCGGLWFDDLEIYQIKTGEANNIAGIDSEKLRTKTIFAEGNFRCPNDNAVLTQFKDSNFPDNLHFDSCQQCGGFWLNRGEFLQFQQERKKIIEKNNPPTPVVSSEDEKFNQQMQALLGANSEMGFSDSMANFSKFLSTPIDPMTNRPFYNGAQASSQANSTIDIVSGVLNIIVRLFLR